MSSSQMMKPAAAPSCAGTTFRVLAVVSVLLALGSSIVLFYSLKIFNMDYSDAKADSAEHPGYLNYVRLYYNCKEYAAEKKGMLSTDNMENLLRSQCSELKFPYLFVIIWAAFTVLVAASTAVSALFTRRWSAERHRITVVLSVLAIASLSVATYYIGSAYSSMYRLVKCTDYSLEEVAVIKLQNNFCITEENRPDMTTAIDLLRLF
eukprot:1395521-Amorphochlora_amoeboformis.AAC.2